MISKKVFQPLRAVSTMTAEMQLSGGIKEDV